MKITVIGVEPPCPRCTRLHTLTREAVEELGAEAEIKKIPFDSEEAQQLGRVGTAHDIAKWASIQIDWEKVQKLAADSWSRDLDDFLMPCKIKADENAWLMTPILVINDDIVCSGYVPEKEFIRSAIINKL